MFFKRDYIEVKSSQICGADYDFLNQIMYVKFNNNTEYRYYDVSQEEFNDFLESTSKGKYFATNIKCKKFTKLEVMA